MGTTFESVRIAATLLIAGIAAVSLHAQLAGRQLPEKP